MGHCKNNYLCDGGGGSKVCSILMLKTPSFSGKSKNKNYENTLFPRAEIFAHPSNALNFGINFRAILTPCVKLRENLYARKFMPLCDDLRTVKYSLVEKFPYLT